MIDPEMMAVCLARLEAGYQDACNKVEEVTADRNQLASELAAREEAIARLRAENARDTAEVERLRVQLAGCSVAALGYGKDCDQADYGWSASYQDCKDLYDKYTRLRGLLADALVLCPTCRGKPGGLVGIGPGIRGVIQVPPCQTCVGGRCPGYVPVGDEP